MKKILINFEGKMALPDGVNNAILDVNGDVYAKVFNMPTIVAEKPAEIVDDTVFEKPKKETPKESAKEVKEPVKEKTAVKETSKKEVKEPVKEPVKPVTKDAEEDLPAEIPYTALVNGIKVLWLPCPSFFEPGEERTALACEVQNVRKGKTTRVDFACFEGEQKGEVYPDIEFGDTEEQNEVYPLQIPA